MRGRGRGAPPSLECPLCFNETVSCIKSCYQRDISMCPFFCPSSLTGEPRGAVRAVGADLSFSAPPPLWAPIFYSATPFPVP